MADELAKQSNEDAAAIRAAAGFRSAELLLLQMSRDREKTVAQPYYREIADFAVSDFKKVVSILNRTGPARFPSGPVAAPPPLPPTTIDFFEPSLASDSKKNKLQATKIADFAVSDFKKVFSTPNRIGPARFRCGPVAAPPPPPPPATIDFFEPSLASDSKKKKLQVTKVVRVPAISSKVTDIPPDGYYWGKYAQRLIKGSPYPRWYYECRSLWDCPAKKHADRSVEDPSMLIVTYKGEHTHAAAAPPPPEARLSRISAAVARDYLSLSSGLLKSGADVEENN